MLNNTLAPNQYYGMTQQAVIDGGMQVWQEGTSFVNPTNGLYTATMWKNQFTNSGTLPTTITHSQNTLTAGELQGLFYSYQIDVNGTGSGFGVSDFYGQSFRREHGTRILAGAGKKVTVSFYAKSSIAAKRIAAGMKQTYGTGGSPSASEILTPTATSIRTLSAGLVLCMVTFTTNTLAGKVFGTNNDDYLELTIYEMWGATFATNNLGGGTAETFVGSGNVNYTAVQFNAGEVALSFQPRDFPDELFLTLEYYFKTFEYVVAPAQNVGSFSGALMVYSQSAATFGATLRFPVQMRVIPLITTYNPAAANANWRDTNNAADRSASVSRQSASSMAVYGVSGAAGSENLIHITADARL